MNFSITKTIKSLNTILTNIFVFLLVIIFPFYFKNAYFNIGYAKWAFFRFLTLGTILNDIYYPGILLVAFFMEIVYLLIKKFKYHEKFRINRLDKYVLIYLLIAFISRFFAYDKWIGLKGYDDWWMGLFAQMAFALVYYFTSRYFKPKKKYLIIWIFISTIIYFLEILNRFSIYLPPSIIKGIDPKFFPTFVSTIGNINWFASYMAITMIPALILFIFDENKYHQYFLYPVIVIIAMSFVSQNSLSLVFALLIILIILLFRSLRKKKYFERYILLILIMLFSFAVLGILRSLFIEVAIPLDSIFNYLTNSKLILILLLLVSIIYIYIDRFINDENINYYKKIITYIFIISLILLSLYILLNTLNIIPDRFSIGLLKLNDAWGNNRGEIWRLTLLTLKDMFINDPYRIIFGAGPDNYKFALYYFMEKEVNIHWFKVILANGHNEWLTALVNYGLVGGLLYLMIFIEAIRKLYKKKENIYFFIIMCSLISYISNNFFSFQQAVSTPIAFFLIALSDKEEIN